MEENVRADKIISQATQWSFEGDCSLLAWMQELSQHIEQRANKANDELQQLNINVNRTAVALDNAANSLTALQYTQFVESRCHDDDETQTHTDEVDTETAATSPKIKSPKEVLETFLQKNLQMLHNCHEKYALDFEDSDDDEGTNTTNYIYQPKNPYNDALLPHIYGSKLWKEHWHVGLCDGSNEYSGDEASDAFSETSSSSADNESYESNTANLSEWASSTSIPIEHKHPALIVAQKEHVSPASATGAARKYLPSTQHLPSNDDSDTYSTTSRSTTTNPPIIAPEHDLFAALRHDTPITSTSTSSSPQQHVAVPSQPQRVLAPKSSTIAPLFDVTPPTDIFADAVSEPQLTNSFENEAVQKKSAAGQIKRKPVNLFDDDDFNSYMTEVLDKTQTNAVQEQKEPPVPASRNLLSRSEANLQPTKTMDLFAETEILRKPAINPVAAPIAIEKPKVTTVRKPVNLFDSREGSPENDSLFTSNVASDNKAKDFTPTVAKPSITAKSLFDDDDDEDDFLNVFGAKKLNLPQRAIGKTLLFDDDNEEVSRQPMNTRTTVNLFEDTPPDDAFIQTTGTFKENNNNKKSNDSLTVNGNVSNVLQQSKTTAKTVAEVSQNNITSTIITSSAAALTPKLPETPPVKPVSKLLGGNIFADDDNDDLDDLFNKSSAKQKLPKIVNNKPIENVHTNVATIKPIINAIKPQKNSLFGEDLAEDDDDDLFGSNRKKHVNHAIAPSKTSQKLKSSPLFGDDFDDDADDLFGVKPAKKLTVSTEVSKNELVSASVTPDAIKDDTQVVIEQRANKSSTKPSTETEVFEAANNESPQISGIKDDDFENTNDLFGTAKKHELSGVMQRAKESKNIFNEASVVASATEPPQLATADEKKSGALKQTTVNGLLIDNKESLSLNVTEKMQKIPTSDVTTEKNVTNEENNVENIKTNVVQVKNTFVDALSSTPNKKDFKEVEIMEETWQHDDNSNENQLDSTSDHNVNQPEILETSQPILEPLEPMEPPDDVVNPPTDTNKQIEPHQVNTTSHQKYASIFLEEPPDDDDFFATLSNNTKPLSVSKLTLDLENDFYEPALPQVPSSARASTTSAATNAPAGTSDYSGLRLFSEIPPDDDDDDAEDFNTAEQSSKQVVDNGVGINRLHSVFYDDFTETLEAVQQIKENKIAVHALFDAEPPPDEELFAVGAVEMPKNIVATIQKTITTTKLDKSEDVQQKDEHSANNTSGAEHPKDVTDRAIPKLEDIATTPPEKPRAATGKLQTPNIKINVQALLPGGGGRPIFKRSPTTAVVPTPTQTPSEVCVPSPSAELSKPTTSASLKTIAFAESANEGLLPSVCKTRVRAPAGRRPSTRRARQVNYQQSLNAEQNEQMVEDFDVEGPFSSSLITRKPSNQYENEARNAPAASSSVVRPPVDSVNLAGLAKTFQDEDDDDDAANYDTLFKPAHTSNNTKPDFDTKTSKDLSEQKLAPQMNSARETFKSLPSNKVGFAESDGDDDDDLFKSVRVASRSAAPKPANNSNATTTTQRVPPTTSATKSLFGNTPSEDSDDDLFKSNKSLSNTVTRTTTKVASTSTTTVTPSAIAIRTTEVPKTTTERKLDSIFGSDDEDDDFLSQLKPKKQVIASLLSASVSGASKPTSASSSGLFSDVESDEDDLFGTKSKSKSITSKAKAITATTTSTSTKQKSVTTKQQPLDKHTTLPDNPLADLLNS